MDKEAQEKIGNISGDEYFNACVKCGSAENLCQYAHRNGRGQIAGWLFSCPNCRDKVSGCDMADVFGYRKLPKDKPPLLSDGEMVKILDYFNNAVNKARAEGAFPPEIEDFAKHIAQAQWDSDIKWYERKWLSLIIKMNG